MWLAGRGSRGPAPGFRPAAVAVLVFLLSGSASAVPRWWDLYRFDDRLDDAEVSAAETPSAVLEAKRLLWEFDQQEVSWRPVRGKMGFRPGELVVKGEGTYPVITSPEDPEIDWARYQSILIRMRAGGGKHIRIKFEHQEYEQELAPPPQWRTYRFEFRLNAPSFTGRLDILPTDSPDQAVAIDSIELVPRRTTFPRAAGRRFIGKQSEFRNALYVHSPSALTYETRIPMGALLRFGTGVVEDGKPVRFTVKAGAGGKILYSGEIAGADVWRDAEVDLSAYQGETLRLVFETRAAETGVVGLWANPTLTSRAPKKRPNVLLYVVDTLRADHTSLYGYSRDTTPFLKQLGAAGAVFEDCHVQATWTKPSVVSLLTSLYSTTHGLERIIDTIPAGATPLAETL